MLRFAILRGKQRQLSEGLCAAKILQCSVCFSLCKRRIEKARGKHAAFDLLPRAGQGYA